MPVWISTLTLKTNSYLLQSVSWRTGHILLCSFTPIKLPLEDNSSLVMQIRSCPAEGLFEGMVPCYC